ncbi:Cytochrome P450 4A24 [Frankliniella fusca]|uniref:Cytochrome P450 4A24 n=1 Tax=Frankliniella fusca TaxID=407009 RepID=A0AAE1I250_9NEOP|nr:Cytochrome P450 4A24 [Frankliniella fusca]
MEIEEKAKAKKAKEAEQEEKRKTRAVKTLDKLLAINNNNKTAKKKVTQPLESSDSASDMEIVDESEAEMWEGDDNTIQVMKVMKTEIYLDPWQKSLKRVIIGKEDKYFVGKVLKERDDEGNLEVSYYRQSGKT